MLAHSYLGPPSSTSTNLQTPPATHTHTRFPAPTNPELYYSLYHVAVEG